MKRGRVAYSRTILGNRLASDDSFKCVRVSSANPASVVGTIDHRASALAKALAIAAVDTIIVEIRIHRTFSIDHCSERFSGSWRRKVPADTIAIEDIAGHPIVRSRRREFDVSTVFGQQHLGPE